MQAIKKKLTVSRHKLDEAVQAADAVEKDNEAIREEIKKLTEELEVNTPPPPPPL